MPSIVYTKPYNLLATSIHFILTLLTHKNCSHEACGGRTLLNHRLTLKETQVCPNLRTHQSPTLALSLPGQTSKKYFNLKPQKPMVKVGTNLEIWL
jgi:hypothetical protein